MSRPIVLATAPLDAYSAKVFGEYGDIRITPDIEEATLEALIPNVVALVVRGAAPITERVLAQANALRVIGRTGVGYDSVDIAAATRRNIPVIFTPGAGSRAVAEGAIAYMLSLCKLVQHWDRELKAANWKSRYEAQGRDLDGQTLGIIGLGRIGQILAEMVKPFNMTVLAADPVVDPVRGAELGLSIVGLDELLRRSDFVSIHCPQIPSTVGMINRQSIQSMKRGAYLINLSRGGLIESFDVLADALDSGQLAGVALDVFDPAPPDVSHRLFSLPNCLCSPHSMATTEGAMTRIFRSMTDDMMAVLRGRLPRFVVNQETLTKPASG